MPILSALFLLPSCAATHYSSSSYGYGTFWFYHLFEGKQSILDELEQKVASTSFLLDVDSIDAPNGVAVLNKEKTAKPGSFLRNCLEFAVSMQEATNGYFSPFSGNLTSLWLDNLGEGKVPSEEDIAKEVAKSSSTYLVFDGESVNKFGEGQIDLGGIGKGYCAKMLAEELKEREITKYWISGGTSSIVFGENPNGKDGYTKVELEDLPGKYVYCKDESISTSSYKKQLYEVNGKKYSHIVNPFTGSAEVNLQAAIVKGSDPAVCDALSTAIYLEGVGSISKYEKEFGVKVIAVKDESVVYCSDGFEILG
ncbi:MAG: FAD:protein FMN transferase [Bacilli bacterium]|nr:FAD:protein FMN transferase [Bacilli bacterium]